MYVYVDRTTGGEARLSIHYLANVDDPPPLQAYAADPRAGQFPDPNRGWHGAASVARRAAYIGGFLAWGILLGVHLATARQHGRVGRARFSLLLLELAVVSTFLAWLELDHRNRPDLFFRSNPTIVGVFLTCSSVAVLLGCLVAPRPAGATASHRAAARAATT